MQCKDAMINTLFMIFSPYRISNQKYRRVNRKTNLKSYLSFLVEGHCNEEMQNMLSCLKKAAFDDKSCNTEILSYNSCIKRAIVSICTTWHFTCEAVYHKLPSTNFWPPSCSWSQKHYFFIYQHAVHACS